jgi:Mrp family chromosome partitioning ATPase
MMRDPKATFLQELPEPEAPGAKARLADRVRDALGRTREPSSLPYRYLARLIEREYRTEGYGICLAFSAPDGDQVTTAALLMLAYSIRIELGATVVLLDARLRERASPEGLTGRLGLAASPGFFEILREGFTDNEHLVQATSLEGVDCLPAGGPQDGPPTPLDRERMRGLTDALANRYDYVLVQLGSLLGDTRNLMAAAELGRVVLVAQENRTMMKTLDDCMKILSDNGIVDVRTVVAS